MLNVLTSQVPFDAKLTTGLMTFCIGMLIIFLGITVIVICVKIAGFFLSGQKSKEKIEEEQPKQEEVKTVEPVVVSDGIPKHVKVAIIGAITAYYFENQKSNCEFIVKKIKRY